MPNNKSPGNDGDWDDIKVIYIYIDIDIYITYIFKLHTHDYLNSRTKFETLVWRLMKDLARN